MLPHEVGGGAERDRRQVGYGPVEQHGGGHLRADTRADADGQGADQAEFGDAETAGGDGQRGQQPDERERRERGLPGYLRLGQADAVLLILGGVPGLLLVAGWPTATATRHLLRAAS